MFPTVMALVGIALPTDRIIDGVDMAPIIFASAPEAASGGHDCILYYKNPQSQAGPAGAAKLTSLAAIRCGDLKVYYLIDGDMSTPMPAGVKSGVQSLEAPVIFDLSTDWSEDKPLEKASPKYAKGKSTAAAARTAHLQTMGWNINQMGLGSSHDLAICSDPDSETKHPGFANCTLTPENWSPPVCLEGGTRAQCTTQTSGLPSCKFVSCVQPPPGPPPTPVPAKNYKGCYHDKNGNAKGKTSGVCDLPHVISGGCSNCQGPNCPTGHQDWGRTLEGCNAACNKFKFFGVQYLLRGTNDMPSKSINLPLFFGPFMTYILPGVGMAGRAVSVGIASAAKAKRHRAAAI